MLRVIGKVLKQKRVLMLTGLVKPCFQYMTLAKNNVALGKLELKSKQTRVYSEREIIYSPKNVAEINTVLETRKNFVLLFTAT